MLITRNSIVTGIERTLDIPITEEAYLKWLDSDVFVQDAFPHLTDDQREFLLTGITPEEWDSIFSDE